MLKKTTKVWCEAAFNPNRLGLKVNPHWCTTSSRMNENWNQPIKKNTNTHTRKGEKQNTHLFHLNQVDITYSY